ncbi:MAG: xylulose kinase [Candidatus Lokiarchaeota archaeon]|nr:xylulose kinase [Candidatus Lokiarchaeota archaeon]
MIKISEKKEKKYVLAHDHGTSGSKAAIVSIYGEVIDWEFQECPLYLFENGGAEQDPDEWWDAILSTSKKLLDKNIVSIEDIVAVSCSSQWSGTVPVDKDGNHLMNAIIWMDTRGAPYIKKMVGGILEISGYGITNIFRWLRPTGGAPGLSGKDPIAHILFLKNERPEIYEKTYKFLECKDFLNLKFTGKFAASYDSITLHWLTDNRDLNNIHYHDGLIKKTKIEKDKLPHLKRAVDVLGNISKDVADELGLEKDVKVVMSSPDLLSAAVGSGAVRDYEAHIYIGTSSWIICHVPDKRTDIFNNIASIPSAIPDKYFAVTEQETAGACLSFLRDNIIYHKDELLMEEEQPDVYKIFDKIVKGVPAGSNKLLFTPWLYGERTPIEDHLLRGSLNNITLKTTREDMIRAVFEGVAYNSRWVLQTIENFVMKKFKGGKTLDPLNMIGGGASSNIWCQIYADVLNRTIRQVKNPIQANARGAAFIASVGLGYITFDEIPKYIEYSNIFKPNSKNREIYDELFEEFLNIYENNKKMYHRLNG